ncbi:MAG: hypothetical protein ACYDBI_05895 [Thermoplasmataceae archaeon]
MTTEELKEILKTNPNITIKFPENALIPSEIEEFIRTSGNAYFEHGRQDGRAEGQARVRELLAHIQELEEISESLIRNIVEHGSHDNWKALSKAIHYFDETSKEAK